MSPRYKTSQSSPSPPSRRQENRSPSSRSQMSSSRRQETPAPKQERPIRNQKKPFRPLDFFSSSEITLVRKDLGGIWARRGVRNMLMLLPVILTVALPLIYLAAISMLPLEKGETLPPALVQLLDMGSQTISVRQGWFHAFTTLICPLLYLTVPVMCAVLSAACVFVGEKEEGTLETLFLSGMQPSAIYNAKITVCTVLSCLISLVAFVFFSVTVFLSDLVLEAPLFFDLEWLATVIFLTPTTAFFSSVFVSTVINRVFSSSEAMQTVGYLLLPFAIVYLIQFTGLMRINAIVLIALSLLILAAALILYHRVSRSFHPERIIIQEVEE